jgi:hypothetical protein
VYRCKPQDCDVTAHLLLNKVPDKTSAVLLSTDVQLYSTVLLLNEAFHAHCSSGRLYTKNFGSLRGEGDEAGV